MVLDSPGIICKQESGDYVHYIN